MVCRGVGIQYLWVDALCIIQDNDDQRDWYIEASQMQNIYSGAAFVIAAHDSPASTSGFLRKRRFTPKVVKAWFGAKTIYWCLNHDPRALQNSILLTRGWALQEELLASRTVHFTDWEMVWECNEGLQCQSKRPNYLRLKDVTRQVTSSQDVPHVPETPRSIDHDYTDRNINDFLRGGKKTGSVYWIWRRIVEGYNKRHLTRAEDKLVALSGLAKVFAGHLAITPEDSYFAGLWRNSLNQDMLWITPYLWTTKPSLRPSANVEKYIAPSWSWASACGPVQYFFAEYQFKFEEFVSVLQASCVAASAYPTGELVSGFFEITGELRSVVLIVRPRPLVERRHKREFDVFVVEPGAENELHVLLSVT